MDELLTLALQLFVVAQAVGIFIGVVGMILMVIYVVADTAIKATRRY